MAEIFSTIIVAIFLMFLVFFLYAITFGNNALPILIQPGELNAANAYCDSMYGADSWARRSTFDERWDCMKMNCEGGYFLEGIYVSKICKVVKMGEVI